MKKTEENGMEISCVALNEFHSIQINSTVAAIKYVFSNQQKKVFLMKRETFGQPTSFRLRTNKLSQIFSLNIGILLVEYNATD